MFISLLLIKDFLLRQIKAIFQQAMDVELITSKY